MPAPEPSASQQRVARVVVVGAGMVGLSTAWFLQERGVDVTVVERSGIAAGSSWGNAGWISPGLAVPLAEPSVLTYGIKAMLDPHSPLYVPLRPDAGLLRFLIGFARRCTIPQWRRTMAHYVPVSDRAIETFDHLEANGVAASSHPAPIIAAFRRAEFSAGLRREIEMVREAGLDLKFDTLDGDALRAEVPLVAQGVEAGIRIDGQRYIDPGAYVSALADAVRERGGVVRLGAHVSALRHGPGGITVEMFGGEPVRGDAVVLATGAWLPQLAKAYGVRTILRAGRGYSFSVPAAADVSHPIYFPYERIACTPVGDRLRVAGTMEFRRPDDPLDPDRVQGMIAAAQPLLSGIDWSARTDQWVGSRPVTVDGLPLVGATKAPGVFVAGGHGMWGITLGPVTGQLLAEQITTGRVPAALQPFDPRR